MKKFLILIVLCLAFSVSAFAQEKMGEMEKAKPTETDKVAEFDAKGKILRGSPIGKSKMVSLTKVLANPEKYVGQTVRVEGVIVRSCKQEGCWMELAPKKDAQSVRVKFKDHTFFIPLQSEGFEAEAEGVFSIKVLSKEEVKHMIEDDGAKFEKINEDGTVTEITFEASGVELEKA